MKEIRLRAWHRKWREMFEWEPIEDKWYCGFGVHPDNDYQDVDKFEWMLDTGVVDVTGRRIYDGDIVNGVRVEFRNGCFFVGDTPLFAVVEPKTEGFRPIYKRKVFRYKGGK